MNAIASVETRGYNGAAKYSAMGKPNSKGQQAYGKYQVMDFNIPAWTKEVLGHSLTPKQFLASAEAQEAVARAKIGDIFKKYGNADDTASVWFSGRPVAKAGNAKDVTGTSVPQYVSAVRKFLPQMGQQIASNAGLPNTAGLLTAYRNLFGTNPNLHYTRSQYDMPANSPTQTAPQRSPLQSKPMLAMSGKITTPYGGNTTQEGFHPGVDIANVKGTPFPSTVSGVVTGADFGHQQGENNFGNSIIVTDANGDQHRFSHLNNGYVKVGQPVTQGQPIGEFGNSGATYSASGQGDGTNLDYRITTAYGKYKNPMLYLKNLS